jgi:multidrug efflux pump
VIINVQRQPGANVIEVADKVGAAAPADRQPAGLAGLRVINDRTTTIRASVRDVQHELLMAVALVVMVIFLFLRSVPATSSPAWRCRCRWSAPSG